MFFETLGNIVFKERLYSSKTIRRNVDTVSSGIKRLVPYGSTVGIFGARSEKLIYIILACLETNTTFIPIDRDIPKERINYMLENAKANYLICSDEDCYEWVGDNFQCISYEMLTENCPDTVEYEAMGEKKSAYILYTSGSTGKPKGVMVSEKSLMNFLLAIPKIIPFKKGMTIAGITSVSFDISLMEIVLGLSMGLNLILADDAERTNPKSIIGLIEQYKIEMLQMTPSMLKMLMTYRGGDLSFLRPVKTLMLGGENLADDLLHNLQENTDCKIYNMYGPTETTIWSSISDLTFKDKVDIGSPIAKTTFYLVDSNNIPVEQGSEGELLIGGEGLADGYVNDSEKTEEKFISLPFGTGERVYKTGDLCRYDENGRLIYLTRIDNQVKINGHRIEPEEIEYCVKKVQGITDAAVCIDKDRMVCFYTADESVCQQTITDTILKFLPKYMLPSMLICVERFEYTISNKIDKKEMLNKIGTQKTNIGPSEKKESANHNDFVEEKVCNLLEKQLESSQKIQIDRDIFNSGMDSIEFVEFVILLEEEFDIEFEEDYLNYNQFEKVKDVVEYVRMRIGERTLSAVGAKD